jgi:hypothetical protein
MNVCVNQNVNPHFLQTEGQTILIPNSQEKGGCVESAYLIQGFEKAALAVKTGGIWECIDRIGDEKSGYLYRFCLMPDFNQNAFSTQTGKYSARINEQKELTKMFPAVEPSGDDLQFINSSRFTKNKLFKELGYEFYKTGGEQIVVVPDTVHLSQKIQEICEKDSKLKSFKVIDSKGVASDRKFIEAYITYDVLISNGKEFVHDQFVHVVPTLHMWMEGNYDGNKKEVRTFIQHFYDKISSLESQHSDITMDDLNTIWTLLGIFTDNICGNEESFNSMDRQDDILNAHFEMLETGTGQEKLMRCYLKQYLNDYRWVDYIRKNYDDQSINPKSLLQLWDKYVQNINL